ncbi:unnamed protein product [Symbiodinium sp. KB8]|nr:unnamed protein product [Symbiodinium sp. KB8]
MGGDLSKIRLVGKYMIEVWKAAGMNMDNVEVNMLAREYCDVAEPKIKHKPVIVSHRELLELSYMLMGLKEGQEKMSKSDPDSAIFMEDSAADVKRKIKGAYCPEGQVANNPILNWTKHIIFGRNSKFVVPRKPANGGDITYLSFEELAKDFEELKLHPGDLKPAVAAAINE